MPDSKLTFAEIMNLLDDYQLLEVPTNASEQEVKTAYRRLARKYHPDKNPGKDTTEHFQRLQTAYNNVLSAIKQGTQPKNWQKYDFTHSTSSDDKQRSYVRETQKAYEELRRNTAKHEKARQDAIRQARHQLHEKRVRQLYQDVLNAGKKQEWFQESQPSAETEHRAWSEPLRAEDLEAQFYAEPFGQQNQSVKQDFEPPSTSPIRAVIQAMSYIVFFAAGVYSTLYWQQTTQETKVDSTPIYVAGLYPQWRPGINHTFSETPLFSEPSQKASTLLTIPEMENLVVTQSSRPDWLSVRYQDAAGWVPESNIGFGSAEMAASTGCTGYPGIAPQHGAKLGNASGNGRIRLVNHLVDNALLRFESYEGDAPFSLYLRANQSFAANDIPKGRYRLVLETGSLYHRACNHFLFDREQKVVMDQVQFGSTELSLTLNP